MQVYRCISSARQYLVLVPHMQASWNAHKDDMYSGTESIQVHTHARMKGHACESMPMPCPATPCNALPIPCRRSVLECILLCTTTKKKDVRHRGAGGCCELTFPRIVTTNEPHHTCTHSTYLEEKEWEKKQTDKYFCVLYLIFETCARTVVSVCYHFLDATRVHSMSLVSFVLPPPLPSPQPRMASEVFCPGFFPWPQGHRATGPGEHSNRRGAAAAGPTGRDVST